MLDLASIAQRNREQRLVENAYPGRGIIIGLNPSGAKLVQVYWIMGRSENSQNRVFVRDQHVVRTQPHNPSKCKDPSLIIYRAIVRYGKYHIVSNGDQTDTVLQSLKAGFSFESALCTRTFEPDPPNFTPRISGLLVYDPAYASYKLSVLKAGHQEPGYPVAHLFSYERPRAGFGHCVHTYRENGSPIPSFEGEPYVVPLPEEIEDIACCYWEALDKDFRVSLVVKTIDARTQEMEYHIINKWA